MHIPYGHCYEVEGVKHWLVLVKGDQLSWSSSIVRSLCLALPFIVLVMSSQLKFTTTHDLRCIDYYVGTVLTRALESTYPARWFAQ